MSPTTELSVDSGMTISIGRDAPERTSLLAACPTRPRWKRCPAPWRSLAAIAVEEIEDREPSQPAFAWVAYPGGR